MTSSSLAGLADPNCCPTCGASADRILAAVSSTENVKRSSRITDALEYLNAAQTAKLIGIEERTLANWRTDGRYGLPFAKIGRLVRYVRTDVEEWIRTRMVGKKFPMQTRQARR